MFIFWSTKIPTKRFECHSVTDHYDNGCGVRLSLFLRRLLQIGDVKVVDLVTSILEGPVEALDQLTTIFSIINTNNFEAILWCQGLELVFDETQTERMTIFFEEKALWWCCIGLSCHLRHFQISCRVAFGEVLFRKDLAESVIHHYILRIQSFGNFIGCLEASSKGWTNYLYVIPWREHSI